MEGRSHQRPAVPSQSRATRAGWGGGTSIREAGETRCPDRDNLGFLPAGAYGWTDTSCGKTRGRGTPQEARLSGRLENASGEFAGVPAGAGRVGRRQQRAQAQSREARDWAAAPAPLGLGGGDSEGGGRGAAGRAGGPRRKARAAPQQPRASAASGRGAAARPAGAARPREGAFERLFVSRAARPRAWAPAARRS